MNKPRRRFLRIVGKSAVFSAFLVQVAAVVRAFVPNVLYEPSKRFKIKRPDDYPEGTTFDGERRLFIIRKDGEFHAISATCTHLGCTVQWRGEEKEFDCPCHGSRFDADGNVLGGPAPRPLPWYPLSRSPEGFLVVDTERTVRPGYRYRVRKA